MRPVRTAILILCLATSARAQAIPSLGGYGGAISTMEMPGGGSGIPYAGRFGGFMPYRMGNSGGVGLSFTPRAASMPIGARRTPFAMPSMSGGMGMGGTSGFRLMPASGGMGSMTGRRGMGVMPPSLAPPFRQPPSLLGPASSASGMSM